MKAVCFAGSSLRSSQLDQVVARFNVEEAATDHEKD
jgi:hypothetical protein